MIDLWNVYSRKAESQSNEFAHQTVALRLSFQESEKRNPRLDPLISAVKIISKNRTSVHLRRDYDPYAILPLETAFAIYETNEFPFSTADTQGNSSCGPIIKVYFFTHPLQISREQMEAFLIAGNRLEKVTKTPSAKIESENNEIDNYELAGGVGQVSYTPMAEHLLFRRMVAEAHSLEGEELPDDDEEDEYDEDEEEIGFDENDPGETLAHQQPIIPKDEDLFPPDCSILYKATAQFEERVSGRSEANYSKPSLLTTLIVNLAFLIKKS